MKKLLVIDGNSILNRQFYGIRPLTNSAGVSTNAVYGFVNVLLSELDALSPDYAAVAFDLRAPTFRHKAYDAYKAGRHATPPELLMQFPYAKRAVEALGLTVLEQEGFEADDILGTLSAMAENEGVDAYILTGDRDSLQLIGAHTTVLLAKNSETVPYTPERFEADYGVRPDQFVDMKALMGDSSDNIPGVAGIGEKTAAKLISACGDLDALYADLDAAGVSAKVKEKLANGKENAYLSRFLAKIVRDAPLACILEDTAMRAYDRDALRALFSELEFSGFMKRLGLDKADAAQTAQLSETLPSALAELKLGSPVSLWFGENRLELTDGEAAYGVHFEDFAELIPFFCRNDLSFNVYDRKTLLHRIADASGDNAANAFECEFDVLLAAYVINASDSAPTLGKIAGSYLATPEESAATLHALVPVLKEKLASDGVESLYYDIELPLSAVLFAMERRGFAVDRGTLTEMSTALEVVAGRCMARIFEFAGHDFNVNSPKQLGEVLFDELKLPVYKKTKSGYSTNAEVLDKLRPLHPIIDLILEYRQVTKLRSTYTEGLLAVADEGGRVHTTFKQALTATGRLSSTEPNLQNIPIRTELGRELRRCFVAKEGYTLVDADYSQIELRLLAACSNDPIMIDAFLSGIDIHTVTASQVFDVSVESVTPDLRKRAKAVNFGIVYGISDFALAEDLHITKAQAGDYIRAYKAKYSGVSAYLTNTIELAKAQGYVTTLLGRRRYIPELSSPKAMLRAFGERVAMNSPIQGSAADIIKIAMIRVENALSREGLDARLILQVHDELILEVADRDVEAAKALLKKEMEEAFLTAVPLIAEVSAGKTWYECK